MKVRKSDRLLSLPPYPYRDIIQAKHMAVAAGRDVIDFGVGDPDQPTFSFIVNAMHQAVDVSANHRYHSEEGIPKFSIAVRDFMVKRYGVELDPRYEIVSSIGSKEAIAHLPLSVVNPGDVTLVPQPAYPVYRSGSLLAGAELCYLDLTAKHGWLPDLENIPSPVVRRAKLLYINYPNNPTAATINLEWLGKVVAWAKANNIIIASDCAYNEIYFDEPPPSILQIQGAKDVSIEFHSLSKTFNMGGWRLGWAAGNAEIIEALATFKANSDMGQFNAIHSAGVAALEGYEREEVVNQRRLYQARRDLLCDGLESIGLDAIRPSATFYIWGRCPAGIDSMSFFKRCLNEADVLLIPGLAFGEGGEGYFRAALTVEDERICQAVERLSRIFW